MFAQAMARGLSQLGSGHEGGFSLGENVGGQSEAGGARGAAAYAREKRRFETCPEEAYESVRAAIRRSLGTEPAAPTAFPRMIGEIPWRTFNTMKKIAYLLLHMMDAFERGDLPRAKGLCAQGLRWLSLSVEQSRDPAMAWRLTFLPDPLAMVHPTAVTEGIDLNNSLHDPQQITATIGMARDMELLSKRIRTDPPPKYGEDKPKGKKGSDGKGGKPNKGD